MSTPFTGKLKNLPKLNSVKQITPSVYFNHWSNNQYTPNKLNKIDNP